MKIPVTDKFLWDLYNAMQEAGEATDIIFNRDHRGVFRPEDPIFTRYRKEKGARKFAKLIYYLKSKNYIKVKNLENRKGVMLTKAGVSKALLASFAADGGKKRRDGKWIM